MRIQLALFVVLCVASGVLADGKIMSRVSPDVPIPDQQALIHYADGVETLVIETSFVGEGNEFAWIIPLPAVPEVKEVSTGLFPSLRATAMPLVHDGVDVLGPILVIVLCGYVLAWVYCPKQLRVRLLLGTFLGLFSCMCLIPALGKARRVEPIAQPEGVTVHARQRIGNYEIATISAQSAGALLDWMTINGFKPPVGMEPVVEAYVREKWVFVAAKMLRHGKERESTTPPLLFRFPTDKPVYPMRLTGLTDKEVRVELWVFSNQRAEAPGFKNAQCKRFECVLPTEAKGTTVHFQPKNTVQFEHAGLIQIVKRSLVLTKLTATLTPRQMMQDVYLTFSPFEHKEEQYYSRSGRDNWILERVMYCGAIITIMTAMAWKMVASRFGRKIILGLTMAVTITCVALISIEASSLDVVEVQKISPMNYASVGKEVHYGLIKAIEECSDLNTVTPEWARTIVERSVAQLSARYSKDVPKIRYGDLPYGYTLHRRDRGPVSKESPLVLITYNDLGGVAYAMRYPGTDGKPQRFDVPLKEVLLSDQWRFRKET